MTASTDRLLAAYEAWVAEEPTNEHQREAKRRELEVAGRQYAASLWLQRDEPQPARLKIIHDASGMGHTYMVTAGDRSLWSWSAAWDGPQPSALDLLQSLVDKGVLYQELTPDNPGLTPKDPAE